MVEYPLEQPYLERFREALRLDSPSELLQIVDEAAKALNWPAGYWLTVRVVMDMDMESPDGFVGMLEPVVRDMASAVALAGQPRCFLAVLRFVFQNSEWTSRSELEQDGRIARFPIDVMDYVKARLMRLADDGLGAASADVIRPELEELYKLSFAISNGDTAAEAIFSRINQVAGIVVDQARAGRDAEDEWAEISISIKNANSEARSRAKRRL